MPINELRSITTFARTAELGSLRRAAAAQSITPQAASQALAQLEHYLGVRLFHRTTRSMTLTEDGRRFLEAARPALAGLQRALTVVRQSKDEMAGPLRIVTPHINFVRVLWPVLKEFCRKYPEVQPDVLMEDRVGNWVEDRVEVGFRIGASPAEGVIARRLFPLQLVICAAPSYLARYGAPQSLEELASHRCSVFRSPNKGTLLPWNVKVDDSIVAYQVPPALCSNNEELETEAVLAGHVIGSLTNIAVAQHVRSGRLVPLLTQHVSDRASVFIYFGSRAEQPARVRAFIDHAVASLKDTAEFVLTAKELATAEAKGRRSVRARGQPRKR
ncbi:LysR family transcriptional regulator [Betaproteobacteria bacterium GR16-43]|nr:LysR family transcriptional regulator [Betaproteobacteria bacterium GR16-43]